MNLLNIIKMSYFTTQFSSLVKQGNFDFFKLIVLFAMLTFLFSCNQPTHNKLPRIAIAGIAIESSTFSPAVTYEEAFFGKIADEVFSYYPFLDEDSAVRKRAVWFPTFRGHAMPGGIVAREAYESMTEKILIMLKEALPLDGLLLDIHGAMSVVGLDDPEGDLIVRIREVIGKDVVISTTMDLHGSVSERLAENTDLITCYRLAPHDDVIETKKRAVVNLLDRLESGKGKPAYKVHIVVPILLPGEKTSTRIEPAKSLYSQIDPLTKKPGIIDAAIWMSYPWADEPRNHGVVMATGDDKEAVASVAEKLASDFWNARNDFVFVAPTTTLDECLEKAINSEVKPFIISDMGDNPTAGGAGDVTWTITKILENPTFYKQGGKRIIYASLPDEKFTEEALALGEGASIKAFAGARVDNRYAPPILLDGTIKKIMEGDSRAKVEVVVEVGNVDVIVTQGRKAYHYEEDFTRLGLNPRETDILVIKIGYLASELYEMRADWIMALTPGGVDQDLERLEYKRVQRPIFPLDKNMADPDLSARFIISSDDVK